MAPKQQQLPGRGSLAGVRMRNDRKRPLVHNLVGKAAHQLTLAVL